MAYTRHYENDVGWEDLPSVATPINATNLNKMDDAIGAIDENAYTEFAAVHQEAQQIATTSAAGRVMPDGTTISVASDGTISATNGMPENPLGTAHGGTGNADGYIRTGLASGVTAGTMSTAEGYATRPTGDYAHAEGYAAYATGDYSHCEGRDCQSGGDYSHAGGQGVAVSYDHQTAVGKFNDNKSGTLFEVGNGTGTNVRSNALEVYANGNVVAGGDITDGYGNKLSDVVIRKSVTQSGTVNYISISSYTPHANDILALSIMNNISVSSSAGEWDISYDGGQTRYPIIKNGNTFNEALAAGTCLLVIWDGSAAFLLINTWDAVEANPSGTATGTLNTLQVGGTIYGMPATAIATSTTPGIVCPDDVTITIDSYGNIYVPRATSSTLGVVQVDGTTITANSSGVISASGSGMPENPLGIAHGGTGNTDGFIRSGQKSGTTIGDNASANGYDTTASGNYSFATGLNTQATGTCAFVIGDTTKALKSCSFAGGYNSQANGLHSFAMGRSVYTTQDNQAVFGIFNDNQTDTLFEVGNGTASNARSNAFQVHSNGNIVAGGTISDANGVLNAVVANPSGSASTALAKLQVGATVYSVSGGGGGEVSYTDLAPAFSDSTSYAVGDYVTYNNAMYRCTTAHSGAWVAADFTAVDVSEELQARQNKTLSAPLVIDDISATTVEGALNGLNEARSGSIFITKNWDEFRPIEGCYVWTDGSNVYYSDGSTQKIFNKATSTWSNKTWYGMTSFSGDNIWTDGTNVYYNDANNSTKKVLDKATSTWSDKTWTGYTNPIADCIWTDGTDYYHSFGSNQKVLDSANSAWVNKTWTGLTNFTGNKIWTDGTDIYYSDDTDQYVLDKANSEWIVKTWSGFTPTDRDYIWTDGIDVFYGISKVLDKSTSTWKDKDFGDDITYADIYTIWTDGDKTYSSSSTYQYLFERYDLLSINDRVNTLESEVSDLSFYLEQTATLSTSATTAITFTSSKITSNSLIDLAVSEWGLVPDSVVASSGTCTVTMPQVDSAHSVVVRLYVR